MRRGELDAAAKLERAECLTRRIARLEGEDLPRADFDWCWRLAPTRAGLGGGGERQQGEYENARDDVIPGLSHKRVYARLRRAVAKSPESHNPDSWYGFRARPCGPSRNDGLSQCIFRRGGGAASAAACSSNSSASFSVITPPSSSASTMVTARR